ncbi:MAG: TlpA family protein disulfide reductase [Pseudomonadota bacterium]|nr:TlpA family protein disulfide reductase [Pseudomonadota bacterium]
MNLKRAAFVVAPLGLAAIAAAAFYGTKTDAGKGACPAASLALADKLRPLAKGEIAALKVETVPRPAATLAFAGADGQKLALADFKGRAVLLNLWATWCVPCRAEMPALDRLQAAAGGPQFEVVTVNVDTARVERAGQFLDEIGVKRLTRYADHSGDAFETLRLAGKALGLPTSLLIDKDGCELGVVAGPANWDSPDALAAVKVLAGGS